MAWREGPEPDGTALVRAGIARRAAVLGGLSALITAAATAGLLPRWPGLVHLVALPPLDLYTDLRLLVPAATSYPSFVAGLIAALVLRTVLLALLLGGLDRRRLTFALRFYLAALPVALVAAFALWMSHAGLYSGLHWIATALALLMLVGVAAAPWIPNPLAGADAARLRPALRASWAAGLRVWPLLAYGAVLIALGGAVVPLGPGAWTAAVPVSAALTLGLVQWLARPAGPRPRLQLAAAGALLVVAAGAFVLAAEPEPEPAPVTRAGSLLAMSGMNSASGGGAVLEVDHPTVFGYPCEQVFYVSYAGVGPGQPQGEAVCPIRTGAPYVEEDTRERPFEQQVALLGEQVEQQVPAPITLLAHSQGAWVAWQAAADGLLEGVETLVVIGPFPDSALGWPPPGERGPGRVGVDVLQALRPVTRAITFDFGPYDPIARDVLEQASVPRAIYSEPLPDDLRVLSVFGIGDLPLNPGGWRIDGAVDACPVISDHPDLPRAGGTQRQVAAFLDGEPLDPCPAWRELVHPLSLPWTPPPAAGVAAYDH
jgi:hypothetical protein